jgi:hypothetical protein
MDIIKKTVLQGFSISVLALAMVACGGSSDDSAPAATPTTPASLTTATDVAKAVAGIEAAKTIFDVVVSDGKDGIEEVIREGRAGKDINCGTSPNAGKFKVITNTGTAYSNDGTGVNETCLESGHKWDGTLDYRCNDSACDNSVTTATNAVWGDTTTFVDLKISGTSTRSPSTDIFKGSASITKSGRATTFTFNDSLTQTYPSKNNITGSGALTVSSASATNCIDGSYSYNVSRTLTMPSGTLRLNSGAITVNSSGVEAGTVTFNADGSVKIKLKDGAESTVSKANFESYCGLKEAYDFSEKP